MNVKPVAIHFSHTQREILCRSTSGQFSLRLRIAVYSTEVLAASFGGQTPQRQRPCVITRAMGNTDWHLGRRVLRPRLSLERIHLCRASNYRARVQTNHSARWDRRPKLWLYQTTDCHLQYMIIIRHCHKYSSISMTNAFVTNVCYSSTNLINPNSFK